MCIWLQQGLNLPTELYKASLGTRVISKVWSYIKVYTQFPYIPKKGREYYADANTWRSISLSSFMLKGLERVVDLHIKGPILLHNRISPHQYYPLRGRNTYLLCISMEDRSFFLEEDVMRPRFNLLRWLFILIPFHKSSAVSFWQTDASMCGVPPSVTRESRVRLPDA